MTTVKAVFYRLGGAYYPVLKNCDGETINRYRNLSLALIIGVLCSAFGGYHFVAQFTDPLTGEASKSLGDYLACMAGAFVSGLMTLLFDYFLLNSGLSKGAIRYGRAIIGAATVSLATVSVLVSANQATIDSQIIQNNSEAIKQLDTEYADAKSGRYRLAIARREAAEKYYAEVVEPEARNLYPGPRYESKKAFYDASVAAVNAEIEKLDELEIPLAEAYRVRREALQSTKNNTFFEKASMLPDAIRQKGWFAAAMVFVLFIILVGFELNAFILKFAMGDADKYQVALEAWQRMHENVSAEKLDREFEAQKKSDSERLEIIRKQQEQGQHEQLLRYLDDLAVREYELRGREEIFRRKGFTAQADVCRRELDRLQSLCGEVSGGVSMDAEALHTVPVAGVEPNGQGQQQTQSGSGDDPSEPVESIDALYCSESMRRTLELIRTMESEASVEHRTFDWILENIEFEGDGGQRLRKTAERTFEEGRGNSFELAALYLAFLKALGINAEFINIKISPLPGIVSHACVLIKPEQSAPFFSDPAIGQFKVAADETPQEFESWDERRLSQALNVQS